MATMKISDSSCSDDEKHAIIRLLEQHEVKVKPSKCKFAAKEVTSDYLGFNLSVSGVHPTHKNILVVKELPWPTLVKEDFWV